MKFELVTVAAGHDALPNTHARLNRLLEKYDAEVETVTDKTIVIDITLARVARRFKAEADRAGYLFQDVAT